ncbi:DNA-directed RNA polymerase III subunit RPC4 [Coemansia sp. RSA 989]|nr:RNA polymerase III RPC4-domain-containing protein [Coemansia mojavensis]KAJ1860587.1 DNA-directed RNA polymerase III subunit RPC4 [Coemansia sp. RSA 989]
MSDSSEKKPPPRGRPLLRGRGRGRPALTDTAQPGGRLASLRREPPAGPAAASRPSGTKLKFTPKIPARRIKREPSTPKLEHASASQHQQQQQQQEPVVKIEKKEPKRERKRFELIERVTGPFAQGPASLSTTGRFGNSKNSSSSIGGFSSLVGSGSSAMAKSEPGNSSLDISVEESPDTVQEMDYNQRARESAFEVQTEQMALEAFVQMNRQQLDCTAAEALGLDSRMNMEDAEDRMVVLQVPKLPLFELDEATKRRVRFERQHATASAMDEDHKPGADAMDVEDVKPDAKSLEESNGNGDMVDGRIGTLVVLKSGAAKLKLGSVLFDVSQGSDCQFLRGLLAVDVRSGNNSVAHMLGNVDAQLLCTPDLDALV